MVEGMKQGMAENGEEMPPDNGKRRFVHLRDARYFSPGQPPTPTNGKLTCRVKLSDVSAFHFGYLSTESEA
jgi:hypothetical protein